MMVWDWRTLGRLHPVTLWGELLLLLSLPARAAFAQTGAWLAISN
jgi:hypothetical protein